MSSAGVPEPTSVVGTLANNSFINNNTSVPFNACVLPRWRDMPRDEQRSPRSAARPLVDLLRGNYSRSPTR